MPTKYIYHPQAMNDFKEALQWYKTKSLQTAKNFIHEVDNTVELICNNPCRWRNEYAHYRELSLKKFPFTIVYSFEEFQDFIVIIAIHHHKKDPDKKYR